MPKGYDTITMEPETADKFRLIASAERRSLITTLDIIADERLVKLGINPAEQPPRRERRRRKAA